MLLFTHLLFFFLRLSSAAGFPPSLSKQEEKAYFIKARAGDKEARRILIERNLRLVAHIAKKYYAPGTDNDDLISVGTIGLIKAIDSYRIDSGTRFATYAGKCLQNEILMYFRSRRKLSQETSLDEPVETDRDGNPLTYMDIISTDDDIADRIDLSIKLETMRQGMRTLLTETERTVLTRRYGLGGEKPMTQREVAGELGISRSYVSRIESGAVEKLRGAFENKGT